MPTRGIAGSTYWPDIRVSIGQPLDICLSEFGHAAGKVSSYCVSLACFKPLHEGVHCVLMMYILQYILRWSSRGRVLVLVNMNLSVQTRGSPCLTPERQVFHRLSRMEHYKIYHRSTKGIETAWLQNLQAIWYPKKSWQVRKHRQKLLSYGFSKWAAKQLQ